MEEGAAPPPLVLIADDEDRIRHLFRRALEGAGLAVAEVASGNLVLPRAIETGARLVVLDINMPDLSGLDVLTALRGRPDLAHIPVILVTGSGDDTSIIRGLEAGADDFLAKPIRLEELVARVRAHLRSQAAWTQALDDEMQRRGRIVQTLGRMRLIGEPEDAAAMLVDELARQADASFIAVLQLTAAGLLQPLASFTPATGLVRGGRSIRADRAAALLQRARVGAWSEPLRASDIGELAAVFPGATVDIAAGSPIYAGESLAGVLVVGRSVDGHAESLAQASLIASTIDFGTIMSAVAGPALADRRQSEWALARLRGVLARHELRPVFQPIVDLTSGEPVGYEALTRFADGTPPDLRFAEASALGLGAEYELGAIEAATAAAGGLPRAAFLSLNISPAVLVARPRWLEQVLPAAGRRTVLEITEHAPIGDYRTLREIVGHLRVDVAVDDAGAGYASLRHMLELRPRYAKLDISLVRGIDEDALRQALVSGLTYYAAHSECDLVAEGVETEAEAAMLRSLGVPLAQGYLFGRPEAAVGVAV